MTRGVAGKATTRKTLRCAWPCVALSCRHSNAYQPRVDEGLSGGGLMKEERGPAARASHNTRNSSKVSPFSRAQA